MEYTKYFNTTPEEAGIWGTNAGEVNAAVKRDYKDTVFRMLFRGKEALLSLYNAVNGTHFTNAEDLEIATLDNAVYMGMKNDVSCVFAFELSLYEHQSTVNPNMPLRDLFYVAGQLQKLVTERNLYSSRRVQIPAPRFAVFYNGNTAMPERMEYKLSDLFQKPVEYPELELIVTVYNINPGMNEALLEACQILKEYMLFTTKIRENRKVMELKDAVNKAVEDCIREGILSEFLKAQRAEVVAMSIFEYDAEKHMRLEKEESYEDGLAEGRRSGLAEGRRTGLAEGHRVGKAEALLLILNKKGELSKEAERRILEEKSDEVLTRWLLLAAATEDVRIFERGMEK